MCFRASGRPSRSGPCGKTRSSGGPPSRAPREATPGSGAPRPWSPHWPLVPHCVFVVGGASSVRTALPCVVLWGPEALDCRALLPPEASSGASPSRGFGWECRRAVAQSAPRGRRGRRRLLRPIRRNPSGPECTTSSADCFAVFADDPLLAHRSIQRGREGLERAGLGHFPYVGGHGRTIQLPNSLVGRQLVLFVLHHIV